MTLSMFRGGHGAPLLLVHGVGSRRQVWDPILPALRERFTVTAVDLPGFGASPPGPEADVRAFADAVQTLHEGPVHVAGSSLGGAIALELGRRGLALSVTAFAPIGFWGPLSRRWCQVSVTASRSLARAARPAIPAVAASKAGRAALFGLFYGRPGRLTPQTCLDDVDALVAATGFDATRDGLAHHRFAGPGALTGIPVTVAWGTRDRILPPFQARRAQAALPSARHVRLPGCGHLPFSDDPAACTRLIIATTGAA